MSASNDDVLRRYGWTPAVARLFDEHVPPDLAPARVTSEERGRWLVIGGHGEALVSLAGRLRHEAASREDLPAVGDWVGLAAGSDGGHVIQAVLPRRSRVARPARGDIPGAQVVAANIDLVLVVAALDHDFNLRRLERYMALAWSSGAEPAIVLNKADTCTDLVAHVDAVRSVAPGVPTVVISARAETGLDALAAMLRPGSTACLLGSSGVGKSSIVNALLGWQRQTTGDVRADDQRGRHTTTRRELLPLPGGALLIDSPGMRSVGMWDAEDGIDAAFEDVDRLAETCRFSDCRHEKEPGCAVQAAIDGGSLTADRLENRRRLERELAAIERRRSAAGRAEQRRQGRRLERFVRGHMRAKYGNE
ncbi:MAG TPA: ribosome small subunit-dependent GTPase A [Candidatus Limnocylindrales bacterium]|nr:ribosome small subunit-dependent GTPase A [Candidatus Limnocylindrales bacterium]